MDLITYPHPAGQDRRHPNQSKPTTIMTIQDLLNKTRVPMTLTCYGAPSETNQASTKDASVARRCRALGAKVTRNIGRDADGRKVNDYGWAIEA